MKLESGSASIPSLRPTQPAPMRAGRSGQSGQAPLETQAALDQIATLLSDLHRLLEEYGPSWYGNREDERISQTLRLVHHMVPGRDIVLAPESSVQAPLAS